MHPAIRLTVLVSMLIALFFGPPSVQADVTTHIVQRGETLFRIALNHRVTVDALRAANGITGNLIYAGQVLVIPNGANTASEAPASQPVVQRGENLFRIGLKYGVSIAALQSANGLSGNTIYVGQRLTIPNGATTVTSSAPSVALSAPTGDGKRFVIDLSEQRLYAYEGDTMVRTTLVSTGLPRTPTVIGTYYIYLRYSSQHMRGPGYSLPGVPYVQYFYKGYGLHGTYWHNNFGQPMSHGCVNLPTSEAEWAYNWATIGTPVIVQP